jgi:hypothetical protein
VTHDEKCTFDPKWCHDCIVQAEARADEREKAAEKVNIAIGENGPLFDPSKITEVTLWWRDLVADIRGVSQ